MDLDQFDAVARSLAGGSRRRLLGVLASLPVAAGVLAILDPDESDAKERRRRRKERHKRRKNPGNRKKGCRPKSKATVCAGQCGPVKNRQTCGKTVDCGSCACDSGTCSGATPICSGGVCVPCSGDNPCPDGCCQPDGSCGTTCRVFASSSTHQGNLGGLTGADAICQDLAETAGLPGMYLAWLGNSTVAPATRFPLAGDPNVGPYVLVGAPEAAIADNWDDLTARPTCGNGDFQSCIDHPIERDETGISVGEPFLAWTGTTTAGTTAGDFCVNWTSNSPDLTGLAGETNKTDQRWIGGAASPCPAAWRLFCFQQG